MDIASGLVIFGAVGMIQVMLARRTSEFLILEGYEDNFKI